MVPARRWHIHISDWVEQNGYQAVNSEKTIFMKRQGSDFIMHGLYIKKTLRLKGVRMSPGLVLDNVDSPELPGLRKHKYYRSFVAKLQIATTWIHFDIAFSVSSLARFCASPGENLAIQCT